MSGVEFTGPMTMIANALDALPDIGRLEDGPRFVEDYVLRHGGSVEVANFVRSIVRMVIRSHGKSES